MKWSRVVFCGMGAGLGAWTALALMRSASEASYIYSFGWNEPVPRVFSSIEYAGFCFIGVMSGLGVGWTTGLLLELAGERGPRKPLGLRGQVLLVAAALFSLSVAILTLEKGIPYHDEWFPAVCVFSLAIAMTVFRVVETVLTSEAV